MPSSKGTGTYSKYISQTPLWPGDLGNNQACYWKQADYSEENWKRQAALAEAITSISMQFTSSYSANGDVAMRHASATSGWNALQLAQKTYLNGDRWDGGAKDAVANRILQHSRRLSTEDDVLFVSTQGLMEEGVDPSLVAADVMEPNRQKDDMAIQKVHEALTRKRGLVATLGVADREGLIRVLHDNPSLLGTTKFENNTFEQHLWLIVKLFQATVAVNDSDHAWSSNAALEKAIDHVVQYGAREPIIARGGQQMDIADDNANLISVVDQAWEDARHIVDIVRRSREHDVQFRSEKAVALLVTRFMYDHFWQIDQQEHIDKEQAHHVVKEHYDSDDQKAKMAELKELMMPYMAKYCGCWPTLQRILDQDPHLRRYWEEHIEPTLKNVFEPNDVEGQILSYIPRGGFDHPELRNYAAECGYPDTKKADSPLESAFLNAARYEIPNVKGVRKDPFSREMDRSLAESRDFARLGGAGNPDQEPDKHHWRPDQAAAFLIGAATRFHRPSGREILYWDEAAASDLHAVFKTDEGNRDSRELSARYSRVANDGSQAFQDNIQPDVAMAFARRINILNGDSDGPYKQLRDKNGVSIFVPLSDYSAAVNVFHGYRESIDTPMRMAIMAEGGGITGASGTVTALRDIEQKYSGLVIPGNAEITPNLARAIRSGLMTALGQTHRYVENSNFDFKFWIDYGYNQDPTQTHALEAMDLGDLIIHVGLQTKHALEQENPLQAKELYLTMAWLCEAHSMLTDPARCNKRHHRDPHSTADQASDIVRWHYVDPYFKQLVEQPLDLPKADELTYNPMGENPQADVYFEKSVYQWFDKILAKDMDPKVIRHLSEDPVRKAEFVHAIVMYMTAAPVHMEIDGKIIEAAVKGKLRTKGISHTCSHFDIRDLHSDYRDAIDAFDLLREQHKEHSFNVDRKHQHPAGPRATFGGAG